MRTAVSLRKPVGQAVRQKMLTKTLPAPLRGLVANESLALSQPGAASVMENMFPMEKSVRLRAGSVVHATVGSAVVESLLVYRSGFVERMFAASFGNISDVTIPVSTVVPPSPLVTGQTSNYYSHVQFATAGGEFMIAVNGTDHHLVYDGTTFAANTPAITGVASSTFSQVWTYKNRLFFVEKGTKTAHYLGVDMIGGAALPFTLNSVFERGGALLFGATWSLDAGDGLDDKCVFVSTNGEVAVYEGSNPSDAANWSLVGRYDFATPLGLNAFIQAGGNLLVCTSEGLVPISEAIQKDRAAISASAVSRPIEPLWKVDSFERNTRPWEIVKWVEKNMAVVTAPGSITTAPVESRWGFGYWGTAIWGGGNGNTLVQDPYCYVVNLQTGAWAKYTGWDVQCLAYFNGGVYFGTADGRIMQAEAGGSDNGNPYVCRFAGLFERLDGQQNVSNLLQARAIWTHGLDFKDSVSFSTNYVLKWPAPPSSTTQNSSTFTWDVSDWDDESLWDADTGDNIKARWVSIGRTGYAVSPMVQVTCASNAAPDAELVSIDLTYVSGGVVV